MTDQASPPHEPPGAVLIVGWPVGPGDLALLCEDIATRLEHPPRIVVCDVSAISGADLAAVDALARMQIVAQRHGGELRLTNACGRLVALLQLAGLDRVIRPAGWP